MSNFAYAGNGKPLRAVTASTGNLPAPPPSPYVVPNNGFTEVIAAHDCLELMFLFEFAAAATGSMVIEEVLDAEASVAGETFDTVTVTSERVSRWNAGEALSGFFRAKNTSGQNALVFAQKRIA